jgi:hypothetical protein
MKQQFYENKADTFKTYVYENNRKIVPTVATITVYRPGSSAVLVDDVQMTIGADGLLSYGLSASDNALSAINYKAVISYTYESAAYYVTLFYDVVKSKLVKVITDDDIVNELPQIKDKGWKVRGSAESGSATTLVDSELKRFEDDYFTGGLAYSIDKDETREITDFDPSTGTVTTSAFTGDISTDSYILTRSYTREIQRAFEKIEERLGRVGKRAHLVLDPYDLRELHICCSVAEVCKGLATGSDTFWWDMYKEYEKKAAELFDAMNFKYDASGDGFISSGEADTRVRAPRPVRK